MLYGEAEQRFKLSSNGLIGAVVFANITSVSEFNSQQFKYWHPGAGFGLQLKFNKYSDATLHWIWVSAKIFGVRGLILERSFKFLKLKLVEKF
jgi:hypothetical protein